MTKKEISLAIVLTSALVITIVGGYFVWNYFQARDKPKQAVAAKSTTPTNSLAPQSTSQDALSVRTGENIGNLGQLSAGQQTPNDGSSSNPSGYTAPGPDTFKSYDQYKDSPNTMFGEIKTGTGTEVKANSKVAIYYKGYLTDGTLFDQTRQNEAGELQPFMFTVGANEVIPGMEQGIIGMKVGGIRRVIIPPKLGYGGQGQGPVPANALLVFDVELIVVQ